MPERYVPISEAAKRLGVHHTTLRKWASEGKIGHTRTVGGRRRFPESEINRLLGGAFIASISGQPKACVYARVSTPRQEEAGNLERQRNRVVNYCLAKGYAVIGVYSDIASGLNPHRRDLMKLLTAVKQGKVDVIVVEFVDRLARFGIEYLERYCQEFGTRIEVMNGEETKDLHQELVEDLLSIVTSFSARLYGSRGGRVARKVKAVLEQPEETEGGD